MKYEYIIEAILFAAGCPIKIKTLSDILGISNDQVILSYSNLKKYYSEENRGIDIILIKDSLQMCTNARYAEYVKKALGSDVKQSLSQASLEVLSIIAYNQPVTRIDIEKIRGVKCERAINTLMDLNLIKENGRVNGPGRPILYVTTDDFLRYFNLLSLKELPPLNNIS